MICKAPVRKERHRFEVVRPTEDQMVAWFLLQVQRQANSKHLCSHPRSLILLERKCHIRHERVSSPPLQVHHKALLHHLLMRPKATISASQGVLKRAGSLIAINRIEEAVEVTPTEGMTAVTVTRQTLARPDLQLATWPPLVRCLRAARSTIVTVAKIEQGTPRSRRVVHARHSRTHLQQPQNRDRTPRPLKPSQVVDTMADMHLAETMVGDETSIEVAIYRREDLVDEAGTREMMRRLLGRATADAMAETGGI